MKTMINAINAFVRNDEGQDLIEYALLAGLVALAAVGAMTNVGQAINGLFGDVEGALNNVEVGGGAQ
jgi:pilus assembly protein Flp/PilA